MHFLQTDYLIQIYVCTTPHTQTHPQLNEAPNLKHPRQRSGRTTVKPYVCDGKKTPPTLASKSKRVAIPVEGVLTVQHDNAGDRAADVTFDVVRLGAVGVGAIGKGHGHGGLGLRKGKTNLQSRFSNRLDGIEQKDFFFGA